MGIQAFDGCENGDKNSKSDGDGHDDGDGDRNNKLR